MVAEGKFRRDLYGRLAGITLEIPPLRDRPEDIEEIGQGFINTYVREGFVGPLDTKTISRWLRSNEARNYHWPGNVRELQNVLRNLLLGLPPGLVAGTVSGLPQSEDIPAALLDTHATLESVEGWYIDRVLQKTDNNLTQAAQVLGVDRSTLRRRLKRQRSV
jgi:transcriptional regulator with PAS, ATPase and Fis domain